MLKKFSAVLISITIIFTFCVSVSGIGFKVEEKYAAVFVITSGNSLGSGFALGKNCIVTNAHVIANSSDITITDYSKKQYKASVYCIDTALDLAVLQVKNANFSCLTVGDDNSCAVGSDVYTIGAPDGMAYTLTKGILSAKNREVGGKTYLQLDAPINPGNSGGPLLDNDGKVIGVNTLKLGESEGIGLAIPMSTVNGYLKKNGIALDTAGNIAGTVSENGNKQSSAIITSSAETTKQKSSGNRLFLLIGAGAAVLVVAAVVIILLYKNRTQKPKLDASDRTDFDIEIF